MDIGKTLSIALIFVFGIFLFPTLNTYCSNVSSAGLGPVIQQFPIIYLIILAGILVYGVKGATG